MANLGLQVLNKGIKDPIKFLKSMSSGANCAPYIHKSLIPLIQIEK